MLMLSSRSRVTALLVSVVLVAGCGSGSSSGSSAAPENPGNSTGNTNTPVPEFSGVNPTQFDFDMDAQTSTSGQFSIGNSGDADLTYSLVSPGSWLSFSSPLSGSVAEATSSTVSFNLTCEDEPQSGSIVITTNDADEETVNVPVAASCTVQQANYEISKVTMNQAARGFDSSQADSMAIPALAGREMLVRAFITGTGVVPEVSVVLATPGSPDQVFPMQLPTAVTAIPADDGFLQASHYAIVPGAAIAENTTLYVQVNPGSNGVRYPAAGAVDLEVIDPGTYELTFVPVTFEGETPTIDIDTYTEQARQVLPIGDVDVEVRLPYIFTGTFELDRLLEELADLRDLDGSDRTYHGVIVPPGGASSGTAGIGYVGFPVSVSVDLGGSAFIIAHELGHNLDLGHAPGCDAPGADDDYPYANGAVETWGYDTVNDQLVSPTSTRRDFMTYCNNLWVSDYNFNLALQYRDNSILGFGPPAGRGLTISGQVEGDQVTNVHLLPTEHVAQRRNYIAASVDQGAIEEYVFEAWNERGEQIVHQSFRTYDIQDYDAGEGFVISVSEPNSPIHHYQIRRGVNVLLDNRQASVVDPLAASLNAAVSWQGTDAQIRWTPRPGQAMVLRDNQGTVRSVDRSGAILLQAAEGLRAQIFQQGRMMAAPIGLERARQTLEWVE